MQRDKSGALPRRKLEPRIRHFQRFEDTRAEELIEWHSRRDFDKPAEDIKPMEWWSDPANFPLFKDIARYAFVAAVIAFLYFRFLRPLLRPAIRKFDEATAIPEEEKDEDNDEEAAAAEAEAAAEEQEEEVEQQRRAQGYRANLKVAQDLAREDPRIVANVIKAWLGSNE